MGFDSNVKVGAGHLVEDERVIQLLRMKKEYMVKRL
jgi:uncharacterized protein YbaP (TraB family)